MSGDGRFLGAGGRKSLCAAARRFGVSSARPTGAGRPLRSVDSGSVNRERQWVFRAMTADRFIILDTATVTKMAWILTRRRLEDLSLMRVVWQLLTYVSLVSWPGWSAGRERSQSIHRDTEDLFLVWPLAAGLDG